MDFGDYAPHNCPICDSTELLLGLAPQDDVLDKKLATAHGLDPRNYWNMRDNHKEFFYIQECGVCETCGCAFTYGQRYYWNEQDGVYNLPPPLTPMEQIREENKRQEEAGQQRLFD